MKLKGRRQSTNIIDKTDPKSATQGRALRQLDEMAKADDILRNPVPLKDQKDNRGEVDKIISNPGITRTSDLSTAKSVDERAKKVRDPKPKTFDFFKHEDISKTSRKNK